MAYAFTPVVLNDLTTAKVDGSGAFDVLMRAHLAHLDSEIKAGRIKGPEYATVYLGSLQATLDAAIKFLLDKDKTALEAELLQMQITLAGVEVQKAQAELAILRENLTKIPAEVALLQAQAGLTQQQTANAVQQGKNLVAEECKLRAEYDVLMLTKDKTAQEAELLLWKTNTEKAQTTAASDPDSVIGKQKALYQAQTTGYTRDAEQKAADIMIKTWLTRRSTDSATVADATNKLDDATVGQFVSKLKTGIGA